MSSACVFCDIAASRIAAAIVLEDDASIAFLDHRPLFPGHVLLAPRAHVPTLLELPRAALEPFFANAQRLAAAMSQALGAQGSFVAINNVVSQSVPHLHLHVVPRAKGDGLRGFFWPRRRYGAGEMEAVAARLRAALGSPSSR